MRHIPSTSPLPDSTYIISNLPPARHTPLTTATKTGRTSRTKIVKNNGAALVRRQVRPREVNLDSRIAQTTL